LQRLTRAPHRLLLGPSGLASQPLARKRSKSGAGEGNRTLVISLEGGYYGSKSAKTRTMLGCESSEMPINISLTLAGFSRLYMWAMLARR
jgi:hypothetical protein